MSDRAALIAGGGRNGELAGEQRAGWNQAGSRPKEDDFHAPARREVNQSLALLRHLVQPDRLVEQLTPHRGLVLVERAQGPEGAVTDLVRQVISDQLLQP